MDECMEVVIAIYFGEEDFTGGALYFHSYKNPSDWDFHNAYSKSWHDCI